MFSFSEDDEVSKSIRRMINKQLRASFKQNIQSEFLKMSYKYMEYECKSVLTDEDMIMIHIDIALENNNKKEFYELTEQLREMKGVKNIER